MVRSSIYQKYLSKNGELKQWGISSVTSFIEINTYVKVIDIAGIGADFYAIAQAASGIGLI